MGAGVGTTRTGMQGKPMRSATAPMMGLFGTVTGMFFTFSAIAAAGGSVSPAQLASGIKMALITTIFGLTVAMPVGVFFFMLRNRVVRMSTEVNAIAEDLFERFRKEK
jgi:biopolymer transport protein ExbB